MEKKEHKQYPVIISYLETDWEKWKSENILYFEVDGIPFDKVILTDSNADRSLKSLIAKVKALNKHSEQIYKDGINAQSKFRNQGTNIDETI